MGTDRSFGNMLNQKIKSKSRGKEMRGIEKELKNERGNKMTQREVSRAKKTRADYSPWMKMKGKK